MKRRSALVACACLAFAGLALGPAAVAQTAAPKPNPGHVRALPDLVITQFGLSSWGKKKCEPGQVMFNFTMTVKNQGHASWTGDSNVFARDLKYPGWFTSVVLPPLAPGASRTVDLPIMYYQQNPGVMSSGSPHPFQATVNDAPHMPTESDYANNAGPGPATYMGKKVIMVEVPKDCARK